MVLICFFSFDRIDTFVTYRVKPLAFTPQQPVFFPTKIIRYHSAITRAAQLGRATEKNRIEASLLAFVTPDSNFEGRRNIK